MQAGERGSAAAGQDDDFELENEQTACAREVHDGEGDTWWKSSGDNDNVTVVRWRDVKYWQCDVTTGVTCSR